MVLVVKEDVLKIWVDKDDQTLVVDLPLDELQYELTKEEALQVAEMIYNNFKRTEN